MSVFSRFHDWPAGAPRNSRDGRERHEHASLSHCGRQVHTPEEAARSAAGLGALARGPSSSQRLQQSGHVFLQRGARKVNLAYRHVDRRVAVRSELHLAATERLNCASDVVCKRSYFGVRHQAAWPQHARDAAQHRHARGRGDDLVKVDRGGSAGLDPSHQIVRANEVCPSRTRLLSRTARRKDGDAHALTSAVRQSRDSADLGRKKASG